MNITMADATGDPVLTGKTYVPLIPPGLLDNEGRATIGPKGPADLLRLDSVNFPDFCGRSASFSFWIEPLGGGGYMLSRYAVTSTVWGDKYWVIYAGDKRVCFWHKDDLEGSAARFPGKRDSIGCAPPPPPSYGEPLNFMSPGQRRHIAFTLDSSTDIAKIYLDGELLGEMKAPDGMIANMDCDMKDPGKGYIGLGHRVPGAYQYPDVVEQWRYYPGEVLTSEEIKKIAYDSIDTNGKNMRTCELESEGGDVAWADLYGHDCAWYQEQIKTVPTICSTQEVREKCPMACGSKKLCFVKGTAAPTYTIWNKIMFLPKTGRGNGVICVREGVDAVADCRREQASPSFEPPGSQDWYTFAQGEGFDVKGLRDRKTTCDALEEYIDPYCSFAAIGPPTQINKEIKANDGYTIDFWLAALPARLREIHDPRGYLKQTFVRLFVPTKCLRLLDTGVSNLVCPFVC